MNDASNKKHDLFFRRTSRTIYCSGRSSDKFFRISIASSSAMSLSAVQGALYKECNLNNRLVKLLSNLCTPVYPESYAKKLLLTGQESELSPDHPSSFPPPVDCIQPLVPKSPLRNRDSFFVSLVLSAGRRCYLADRGARSRGFARANAIAILSRKRSRVSRSTRGPLASNAWDCCAAVSLVFSDLVKLRTD